MVKEVRSITFDALHPVSFRTTRLMPTFEEEISSVRNTNINSAFYCTVTMNNCEFEDDSDEWDEE